MLENHCVLCTSDPALLFLAFLEYPLNHLRKDNSILPLEGCRVYYFATVLLCNYRKMYSPPIRGQGSPRVAENLSSWRD